MADIAAGNVTYTINDREIIGTQHLIHVQIAFGNGALTYPSGGVPLTNTSMGIIRNINSLVITESNATALMYEWDKSANTIRIFYPTREYAFGSAGTRAGVELTAASSAPPATVLQCVVMGW